MPLRSGQVFHHQRVGKYFAAVGYAFHTVVRGIIRLLITLRQGNTGNVGIILDNNIGLHIRGNRITQIIRVQIVSFRIFPVHDVIRIMLIGIVNGGIIYGQAKTIVLRMVGAIGIRAVSNNESVIHLEVIMPLMVLLEMLNAFARPLMPSSR